MYSASAHALCTSIITVTCFAALKPLIYNRLHNYIIGISKILFTSESLGFFPLILVLYILFIYLCQTALYENESEKLLHMQLPTFTHILKLFDTFV